MANLLIFSNKRYGTDFRKYLMRAAERAGSRAVHVYIWEKVIVTHGGTTVEEFEASPDIGRVLRNTIMEILGGDAPIVGLTGLGGNDTPTAAKLHESFSEVSWVYDVYDDLLYNAQGIERVNRGAVDAIWRCRCRRKVVLDVGLKARYPGSYHLNNASHLTFLPATTSVDVKKMVYIGSIDSRVDLDWLRALASNDVTIDIFGTIHCSAPEMQAEIDNLVGKSKNIQFRGTYDNDDLPGILCNYRVGLLPYKAIHPMTKHVNPDKMHHYLNAGLEVLAAPIPAVSRNARYLHIISTGGNWSKALDQLATEPRQKDWPRASFTWDRRWHELERFAFVGVVGDDAVQLELA